MKKKDRVLFGNDGIAPYIRSMITVKLYSDLKEDSEYRDRAAM